MKKRVRFSFRSGRFRTLSAQKLAIFCGQLGTMLSAGVGILPALRTIAGREHAPHLQDQLHQVAQAIARGHPLADALEDPAIGASPFLINIIRTGEATGELDRVLFNLETFYSRQSDIRNNLFQIFIYPIFVLCLTVAVTHYLVRTVMPVLLDSLTSMDRSVPPGSRLLITLSRGLSWGLPAAMLLLLFGVLFARTLPQDNALRQRLHRLALRLPLIGRLFYLRSMEIFADSLAMMVRSGVALIPALQIVCQNLQNDFLRARLSRTAALIESGMSLTESLERIDVLDAEFFQLIQVGESAGSLAQVLSKAAAYYHKAYQKRFKRLSAVLEPAVLVIVGVLVAVVVLSFMSILYAIYTGYASLL